MIMKKNQFNEDTKTKTKDKVDFDFDSLDDLLADPKPANITKPEQPKTASNTPAAGNKKKVSSTVATDAETRARMKNVKPSADAINTLRGMEMKQQRMQAFAQVILIKLIQKTCQLSCRKQSQRLQLAKI
jgi:hypothetical protein